MAGSARATRKLARAAARQTALKVSSKRAVGYVRVSTEEQASRGSGLEVQAGAIRSFADSQGFELVDIVTDAGASGATPPAERPGFVQVLAHAGTGGFVLLVWRFDRFSRNIRHALNTVQELLTPQNIELRSVTEAAIDTGSTMGRTIFSIFAGMAESERETITLRTKSGRLAKAQKGGIACGTPPFGYRRNGKGGFVVVEAEAAIVREIFALRADRLGLQLIADRLNSRGVRGRKGGIWRPGTVAAVLDNTKYRGALEYVFAQGEALTHVLVPGAVEAIVA